MGWFGRPKPAAKTLTVGQETALSAAIAGCRMSRKHTEFPVVGGGSAYAYADGDLMRWAVLAPRNVKVADGVTSLASGMRMAAE